MDRETAEEIKKDFNVVAEGLRSEIRTVAKGLGGNNDRLDRFEERLDRIEARMTEEFSEIKAMIRLSFGELDRRIRSLESDVNTLRARLEKIEARFQARLCLRPVIPTSNPANSGVSRTGLAAPAGLRPAGRRGHQVPAGAASR